MEEILFKIAITKIKGVGDAAIKTLVAHLGGLEPIFIAKENTLRNIPGINQKAYAIIDGKQEALEQAKRELDFMHKNGVNATFYTDKDYPLRLKECNDAPVLLYHQCSIDLNPAKVLSIVGTRRSTSYGTEMTKRLIAEIAQFYPDVLIVSGLAYGIDAVAHRSALKHGLPTLGVLAHGLDNIYPSAHASLADKMKCNGGILSEFPSSTRPIPENFVRRNRIVAGICDACIVIESAKRGGSLITASIANSYNREVFAVPGNSTEPQSEGCNFLIKTQKAAMVEGIGDLEYMLNWSREETKKRSQQTSLLIAMTDQEQMVFDFLIKEGKSHINPISIVCKLPMSVLNPILINMEFSGLIKCYPGNVYEVC